MANSAVEEKAVERHVRIGRAEALSLIGNTPVSYVRGRLDERCIRYARMMLQGSWSIGHLALSDGRLHDGLNRVMAVAISQTVQEFTVNDEASSFWMGPNVLGGAVPPDLDAMTTRLRYRPERLDAAMSFVSEAAPVAWQADGVDFALAFNGRNGRRVALPGNWIVREESGSFEIVK